MTGSLYNIQHKFRSQIKNDFFELKSDLKFSYFEAFLSSFIVGIAENFFAAFSIEKGMTTIQSGLLLSLPLIFAIGLNLFFNFYKTKKSITQQVSRNVLLQIFSLFGLIALSSLKIQNTQIIFIILMGLYSVYWYGNFASQPAWNTWISEILDFNKGSVYFALRARLNQMGIITGLIVGGLFMQSKTLQNIYQSKPEYLFSLLFGMAVVAQFLKFYSFKKHPDSSSVMNFSFKKIQNIFLNNKSFFLGYSLFNTSLFLSAPYVTGYLLTERKVDYPHFMMITASLFVGKIMTTFFLSANTNKYSPMKMMSLGGLVAAPLPLLWPFCHNIESMFLLHFVSGTAWGLWEVGLSLSFFKNITAADKNETVTLYNMIGIMTQVIGTCIGALCIKYVFNYNFTTVFICSGLIRLLCVLPLQKSKSLSGSNTISNKNVFDPENQKAS